MPTTSDYIRQLEIDKSNMAKNLENQGLSIENTETFTEMVPKIMMIGTVEDYMRIADLQAIYTSNRPYSEDDYTDEEVNKVTTLIQILGGEING